MRLTEDNVVDYADTLVLQARGSGHVLDYSEESLGILEERMRVSDELLLAEEFPEPQRNLVVFYTGCYVGEVMSRQLGGVWRFAENWFDSTLVFSFGEGGLQVHPFAKVYRRVTEGPAENDLAAYYEGVRAKLQETMP